jgi:hypothetical protein
MSIDPMKSGGANSTGGSRVDQAGSNQSARPSGQVQRGSSEARAAETGDDQVQLSERARESGAAAATSPSGLTTERLQEILKRLTSGYYDSPQVLDRVAERVKDDLTGTEPVV